MTVKKKTEADEAAEVKAAAEAKHLAEVQAFEAERVRIREAAQAEENARREAEAKAMRVIAILDDDGVLVGRVDGPTDAEWNKAPPELRFVNGFDNALHRYRLVEWKPGRFRFEPVVHEMDQAKENSQLLAPIVAPLTRVVLALAMNKPTRKNDLDELVAYLKTFDAKGA